MNTSNSATLWHVYHYLWGKATDAPHYQKRDWNDLFQAASDARDQTGDSAL
jgi:hypothetical protein